MILFALRFETLFFNLLAKTSPPELINPVTKTSLIDFVFFIFQALN